MKVDSPMSVPEREPAHVSSATARRAQRAVLLLLFALGMGVRLTAVTYLNVEDRYTYDPAGYLEFEGLHGDDREYEGRAWNLVSGGNFWSLPNGDGNAPPGYAFLIALTYAIAGRDLSILFWLNAGLGGGTAVLTYLLGRRLAGHHVGSLAGVFVSVDPLLVYWSTRILPDTLTVFLAMTLLVGATQMTDPGVRVRTTVLYGLLMAAAILVRNQLIAVVGAAGLWLLTTGWRVRARRHGLAYSAAVCCAIVFVVTGFGMTKRPAGTISQVEQVFDRSWLSTHSHVDLALERAAYKQGRVLTPEERRSLTAEASRYVRETPAWKVLLWNWTERIQVFWRMNPGAGGVWEKAVYLGSTALLFSLSLAGLLATVVSTKKPPRDAVMLNGLLILTCLAVMFLHLLIIAKPRYRLPLHPILWIWASSFLVALPHKLGRSNAVGS
jgi:4-amino-4-deoxy-L-arabinose transferase-like glycosyltransferase